MKDLSKKINNILNDEILNLNKKIKGTSFLEILKFNLIDKLSFKLEKSSLEVDIDILDSFKFEDDQKKIVSKIIFYKNPKIILNTIIKTDLLLICLDELIKIDIEDNKSKKHKTFNLYKSNGIAIPQNTNCNFNFCKKSIVLDITHLDKNLDIENLKENTI